MMAIRQAHAYAPAANPKRSRIKKAIAAPGMQKPLDPTGQQPQFQSKPIRDAERQFGNKQLNYAMDDKGDKHWAQSLARVVHGVGGISRLQRANASEAMSAQQSAQGATQALDGAKGISSGYRRHLRTLLANPDTAEEGRRLVSEISSPEFSMKKAAHAMREREHDLRLKKYDFDTKMATDRFAREGQSFDREGELHDLTTRVRQRELDSLEKGWTIETLEDGTQVQVDPQGRRYKWDGEWEKAMRAKGFEQDPENPGGLRPTAGGPADKVGQSQRVAAESLGLVEEESKRLHQKVYDLQTHPNRENATGWSSALPTFQHGTQDFEQKAQQLESNAFLLAFQKLKGGGAITDAEGSKAARALSRLRDFSLGEKEYAAALEDFTSEVRHLLNQARIRAGRPTINYDNLEKPRTLEEARALPPGTQFISPKTGEVLRVPSAGSGGR